MIKDTLCFVSLAVLFFVCTFESAFAQISITPSEETQITEDKLHTFFEQAAAAFEIPANLLKAIGVVESKWDQKLINPKNGEIGIMQLNPTPKSETLQAAAEFLRKCPVSVCGNRFKGLTRQQLERLVREYSLKGAEANIWGGAAVLRKHKWETAVASGLTPKNAPKEALESWWFAVAGYNGFIWDGGSKGKRTGVRSNYVFRVYNLFIRDEQWRGEQGAIGRVDSLPISFPASQEYGTDDPENFELTQGLVVPEDADLERRTEEFKVRITKKIDFTRPGFLHNNSGAVVDPERLLCLGNDFYRIYWIGQPGPSSTTAATQINPQTAPKNATVRIFLCITENPDSYTWTYTITNLTFLPLNGVNALSGIFFKNVDKVNSNNLHGPGGWEMRGPPEFPDIWQWFIKSETGLAKGDSARFSFDTNKKVHPRRTRIDTDCCFIVSSHKSNQASTDLVFGSIIIPAPGAMKKSSHSDIRVSELVSSISEEVTQWSLAVFSLSGQLILKVSNMLGKSNLEDEEILLPNGIYLAIINTRCEDDTIIKSEVRKLVILR